MPNPALNWCRPPHLVAVADDVVVKVLARHRLVLRALPPLVPQQLLGVARARVCGTAAHGVQGGGAWRGGGAGAAAGAAAGAGWQRACDCERSKAQRSAAQRSVAHRCPTRSPGGGRPAGRPARWLWTSLAPGRSGPAGGRSGSSGRDHQGWNHKRDVDWRHNRRPDAPQAQGSRPLLTSSSSASSLCRSCCLYAPCRRKRAGMPCCSCHRGVILQQQSGAAGAAGGARFRH